MIAHQYFLSYYPAAKINKKQHSCIVYSMSTRYCIVPIFFRINQGGLPLIKVKKEIDKYMFTD